MVVAVAAAAVAWTGRVASGGDGWAERGGPRASRYVIRPGDTLWGLARARVGPQGDPRPLVQEIRRANGLDPRAPLLAGMELVIPAA